MGEQVAVVGTGLIGGSLGKALVRAGYEVVGFDADRERLATAVEEGAVSAVAASVEEAATGAAFAVVAVPVSAVAPLVVAALDAGAEVVTDVGSVKAPVVREVERARPEVAARYVGGHPMAGSEQEGLAGADPDLFQGATWVLTPTAVTDPAAFTRLRALLGELGAEVVAVDPVHHDELVARVSHLPHLAAGTLMLLAAGGTDDTRPLLRLAAGGFRDMTRIAAGHPGIWPDICAENRDAIVAAFDEYLARLGEVREAVARGDRQALLELLETAREARVNLPVGAERVGPLVELRIPVPDRPGVLAEVTTLAGQLGVNIEDLEIAHSLEGAAGVIVMVVPARGADALEARLHDAGYRCARRPLE